MKEGFNGPSLRRLKSVKPPSLRERYDLNTLKGNLLEHRD